MKMKILAKPKDRLIKFSEDVVICRFS